MGREFSKAHDSLDPSIWRIFVAVFAVFLYKPRSRRMKNCWWCSVCSFSLNFLTFGNLPIRKSEKCHKTKKLRVFLNSLTSWNNFISAKSQMDMTVDITLGTASFALDATRHSQPCPWVLQGRGHSESRWGCSQDKTSPCSPGSYILVVVMSADTKQTSRMATDLHLCSEGNKSFGRK